MAVESFYISIEMTENLRNKILEKNNTSFSKNKIWGDLVYKNILYINDCFSKSKDSWWHINACYFNFFESCEALYDLLTKIKEIMPNFQFTVFKQKQILFEFSFMGFIQHVHAIVGNSKLRFEEQFGKFSVLPNKSFYKFKRKNNKYFVKYNKN